MVLADRRWPNHCHDCARFASCAAFRSTCDDYLYRVGADLLYRLSIRDDPDVRVPMPQMRSESRAVLESSAAISDQVRQLRASFKVGSRDVRNRSLLLSRRSLHRTTKTGWEADVCYSLPKYARQLTDWRALCLADQANQSGDQLDRSR